MIKFYRILFFFSFLLFSVSAWSQVVIESNEYDITIGSKYTLYYVTDFTGAGITVNLGTKGGPQTWSFSPELFPGGSTTEYTTVDPATTPYAAQFPTADHVWYSGDPSDTISVYSYFDKTNTGLFGNGFAMVRGDSDFVTVNDPPSQILPFPASMNTKWTNTEVFEFGIPGVFMMVDSSIHDFEIDAWGTINTPDANYECLRVFEAITRFTKTYSGNQLIYSDSTGDFQYTWYAENVGMVAQVVSFFNETNPNFTRAEDISFRVSKPVRVKDDMSPVARSFQLMQNYPNPFNPTTTIGFNLPLDTQVSLKIYDIQGREIETLFNGFIHAGYHEIQFDGSKLSSGIYLYKITSNHFSEVRKMMIVR